MGEAVSEETLFLWEASHSAQKSLRCLESDLREESRAWREARPPPAYRPIFQVHLAWASAHWIAYTCLELLSMLFGEPWGWGWGDSTG